MTKVIAEIGCNHKGDLDIAKKMIYQAKFYADVNIVKFQKRNNKELLTEEEFNAPHPSPWNSYGLTYGEHREYLEFSLEQHKELQEYCKKYDVEYSSSVWDLTSAKEIASLNPSFIKIPSPMNHKLDMIEWLILNYSGDIHLSLGMTKKNEEEVLINLFKKYNSEKRLILYICTSGYPVEHKDLYLLEILRLKQKYPNIKDYGFSGHHLGIAMDIAAVTLGANYVERHFTLDRTWKGTDHAASLEPDGLRKLVRDLKALNEALRYKPEEILEVEKYQRLKFRGTL